MLSSTNERPVEVLHLLPFPPPIPPPHDHPALIARAPLSRGRRTYMPISSLCKKWHTIQRRPVMVGERPSRWGRLERVATLLCSFWAAASLSPLKPPHL